MIPHNITTDNKLASEKAVQASQDLSKTIRELTDGQKRLLRKKLGLQAPLSDQKSGKPTGGLSLEKQEDL